MSKFNSVSQLNEEIKKLNLHFGIELKELVHLLELLEKVNTCNQEYEIVKESIVVSYNLKLNLFNFRKFPPLYVPIQVIGLPISVSTKGYFGDDNLVEKTIKNRKGLKILLNGDSLFNGGGKTLSTFIFENKFKCFDDYLNALRSPYRRRINKALRYRDNLHIRRFINKDFNSEHYNLYLSIMSRTDNPLETLPVEFFREYDAELYEFINKNNEKVIGFIQLKKIENNLYFLFGGFNKDDVKKFDIYYNMLLKIVEIGIEKQVSKIEFGQTAEESKIKIGCKEKFKYLYIHHSNPIINFFIQMLVPIFSYKPYPIKHHVFKLED